jgi:ElaB/YqjD/DUF883 family membrane-anchored ribosome-binding protein
MAKRRAMQAKNSVSEAASGLQDVIDSAEELLEDLHDQQGAATDRLREKLSATLSSTRDRLANIDVQATAGEAYDAAVGYLRQDPWRAVALGTFAVLAVALLIRSNSED